MALPRRAVFQISGISPVLLHCDVRVFREQIQHVEAPVVVVTYRQNDSA